MRGNTSPRLARHGSSSGRWQEATFGVRVRVLADLWGICKVPVRDMHLPLIGDRTQSAMRTPY